MNDDYIVIIGKLKKKLLREKKLFLESISIKIIKNHQLDCHIRVLVYIYRFRFCQNRYPDFFSIGVYVKLYSLKNLSPSNYRLGSGKRLRFMSGLTLPAAVARGRHRKPTLHHAECDAREIQQTHSKTQ